MNKRIHGASLLALLAAALLGPMPVHAQAYPDRPIRMIVPFPAGSSTDAIGREVASFMAKSLNQSIVVDNRPGALATLGASEAARAKPDGYTLFLGTSTSQAAAPSLFRKLSYNPDKDFAPIGRVGAVVFALVVRADLPASNVQELIDLGVRKSPKPLAWGYANSANQVAGSALVRHGNFDATAVPYKGVPQIMLDMLGGNIDFTIADMTSVLPHIRSGKLRALAVTTPREIADLPGVPPLGNTVKGFQLLGWYGLFAPAGTPEPIVAMLSQRLLKGMADPAVQKRIETFGLIPYPADGPELRAYVTSEIAKWSELIKAARIEPE